MYQSSEDPAGPSWFDVVSNPVRLAVVRSLTDCHHATAMELVRRSNASAPTVRRHLERLVALGVVREHTGEGDGLTPGRPAAQFSLPPDLRQAATALLQILAAPIDSFPRRAAALRTCR